MATYAFDILLSKCRKILCKLASYEGKIGIKLCPNVSSLARCSIETGTAIVPSDVLARGVPLKHQRNLAFNKQQA